MFDIDREHLGAFIAQLRREKGMTQKELAQRLYISDKAVSKWERGAGMPDISLIMPLAEALGVTASELLQARRMALEQQVSAREADELVQRALSLRNGARMSPQSRKRWGTAYGICLVIAAVRSAMCFWQYPDMDIAAILFLPVMLAAVFGAYSCLFAKERLPAYYDENRINGMIDGPFRMNIPGVYFTNRNWPHILKALRIWTLVVMVAVPLAFPLSLRWENSAVPIMSVAVFAIVPCVYIPGLKYK